MIELDVSTFACNIYPAQPDAAGAQDVLFRAHTDSGTLTLLHQQGDYAGLEVYTPDGWLPITVNPDALVVNIGDLMARWTNGHWKSTIHRVVSAQDPTASRRSITTFHLPSIDTIIEPLAPFAAMATKFTPVTTYEWEGQFLRRVYAADYDATAT
jgi:isopenicillin N synthase-like dioxygenase